MRRLGISVRCEGLSVDDADWIVLEAHECMIHIFDPETRAAHSIDEQLQRPSGDAAADGHAIVQQLASSTPRRLSRLRQLPPIGP